MTDNDHRQIERDSLFVMADLRVEGVDGDQRIKVRNLSAGGMMAEGDAKVRTGSAVGVNIRNIGWVEGSVAWIQDNRFGIAFHDEIDPKVARAPLASQASSASLLRHPAARQPDAASLRKL